MQADWIQPLHRLKPRLHPMYFYSPTIFMILDRTTQCGIDFSKLSIINLTYRYFNLHTPVCSSPPFIPLERIWSLPMPRLLWLQRRWLTQLPTVQLHLSVPSPECEGFLQEIVTFDATSILLTTDTTARSTGYHTLDTNHRSTSRCAHEGSSGYIMILTAVENSRCF